MREYIEKKKIGARICLVCLILATIGLVVSIVFVDKIGEPTVPVILLSMLGLWFVLFFVYIVAFLNFQIGYRRLVKQGEDHIFDEMESADPNFKKSKIVATHKGFVCKRNFVVLTYDKIAWVYQQQMNVGYGVARAIVMQIYCKDGKCFMISGDKEEIKQFLSEYILKYNPDVLVGFGKEQREQFNQKYGDVLKKQNRVNRILGIAIICIGVAIFIGSLFDSDGGELTASSVTLVVCGIFLLTGMFKNR